MTTAKATKISKSDLKFFPSERLTDNDDGGGLALGTPIAGKANELFNPISSIAKVNGGFYARMLYGGVQRPDAEPLIGAFSAITVPPKDPNVSYLLFKASKFGELRKDILKRIEAYSTGTYESKMTLLSTQTKDSKIVQAYQRVGESLPIVGDVYCLRQDKGGYPKAEQYIKVVAVKSKDRTFSTKDNPPREFTRTVVQLETSQKLIADFVGVDYPSEGYVDNPCKILETQVVDAANYYGVKPLAQAITKANMTLQVTSLFEKIVPTNQIETALVDLTASGQRAVYFDASKDGDAGQINQTTNIYHQAGRTTSLYLGVKVMPNTLSITTDSGSITDKNGNLIFNNEIVGLIDYRKGEITLNANQSLSLRSSTFRVAAYATKIADTAKIDVTINNRSYTYTYNINPSPAVGSLNVSYRALGRWYDLMDDGTGALRGASQAYGSGNINYATGSITLSLGELPDVGSAILFSWGTKANYTNRSNLVISPVKSTQPTGDALAQRFTSPSRNGAGQVVLELAQALFPKQIRLRFNVKVVQQDDGGALYKDLKDDGQGKIIDSDGVIFGSVNYSTGQILFNPILTLQLPKAAFKSEKYYDGYIKKWRDVFAGYTIQPVTATFPLDGRVDVLYYKADQSTVNTLQFTFVLSDFIVPSSLSFVVDNVQCFDKNGDIFKDLNPNTGTGTKIGTINYQTNEVTLPNWQGAGVVTLKSLVSSIDLNPVTSVTFRTSTAPIRPNSLQIRATALDGTKVSVIADTSGKINSEWVKGTVNAEQGVVDVEFGKMIPVTDEMRQSPNFDAEAVVDGKIWQAKPVIAESVLYNAVGYSYLPIDSSIVKIDTVRLPQDGRVPIFRRGDSILISNKQTQNLGSAFTAGQTIQLDKKDLDRICLVDSQDKPVLANLWDYDLDAGSITFATPLDLSGYALPLQAHLIQEERNRIIKADIDGTLSLNFPLKRDYQIKGTYVSSLLIGGDLQVRVSVPFTQRNWTNLWQDEPIGDQLLSRLNVKDYPIKLTDDGAITERWLIKWVSGSQFELYGETLGFVQKTDTLQDLAPINPSTKKPYFTIPRQAFGNDAPWASQDVIRFNTWGTLLPMWVLCAVQPSSSNFKGDDGFTQALFGDTTEI
ncbi:hypothetical protein [Acinetobacter sp. c3-l95]|uniref:hypothetical protein n=1 Tax=Acinetobacter sp. c3-l95 TaxID=3342804 RepID=UPI0035B8086B